MRRNWPLVLVTLALLACRHPLRELDPDVCTLRIRAGTDASRTVVPDFDSLVDKLTVTLKSDDGYEAPLPGIDTEPPWQVSFTVAKGQWDIDVAAMRNGVQIGWGHEYDVVLEGGLAKPVDIVISFPPKGASGSVKFAPCVDPDTLGVSYVLGSIEGTATKSQATLTASGGVSRGTLAFPILGEGPHTLVMTFRRGGIGGSVAGIFREKLVVVPGYETASWVGPDGKLLPERTFTAADF